MLSRRLLLAVATLAVLLMSAAPGQAAFPGLNGKIAFTYTPGNPGTSRDIYLMQPDGSGQAPITGLPDDEDVPSWSADGTKIAFHRGGDVWVMNSDGTGQTNLTTALFGIANSPSWSPDGSKIAFSSTHDGTFGQNIYTMQADGSQVTRISFGTPDDYPAWSPDGQRIAFVHGGFQLFTVKTDGSDATPIKNASGLRSPDWSPSGARIAYVASNGAAQPEVHTIDPDGSNDVTLSALSSPSDVAWSPDGSKLVATSGGQIWTMNADGTSPVKLTNNLTNNRSPDWQPLPYPGYPRPKGATPMRLSIVPAYATCAAPNRTHGPPLAFGSCNPPSQTSPNLTVGTPDAGGAPANFSGFVIYDVLVGAPGPPDDSDLRVKAGLSDVRCVGSGAACGPANASGGDDYTGDLQLNATARLTDKWNAVSAGGGSDPATMIDIPFPLPIDCAATPATSIGASCSVDTSLNAVTPAAVKDGDRRIVQLSQVQVFDGGPDGQVSTADNDLFAVQGLFVP
jgi:dipeptidyl aminopeptidase/acylaminoacyl peptidase